MRIHAVIFDWAGTVIDFGSCAPVFALQRAFDQMGIELTEAEARRNMGLAKRDHILAILQQPAVAERWRAEHGKSPCREEANAIYERFLPIQKEVVVERATVIPGVATCVAELRSRGIRIGSTTGYYRELMEPVLPLAANQGFDPDCVVTPDDVEQGRPAPHMILKNLEALEVSPEACIKVGDTPADVEEGRNAGVWTVAVAATGNELGLDFDSFQMLDDAERARRLSRARRRFDETKPNWVLESVTELTILIDRLEADCHYKLQ